MRVRLSGLLFLLLSVVGFGMSFLLLLETWLFSTDPDYVPVCSFNDVLNCGSTMLSDYSDVLGLPNPVMGLVLFSGLVVVGLLGSGGVWLPLWFRGLVLLALSVSVVFVHWFVYLSFFVIGSLCPYCIVVWLVTMPLFVLALRGVVSSYCRVDDFVYVMVCLTWLVSLVGSLFIVFW